MRELSLFTGMGGGIYGSLILGWETAAYVEKDTYCQSVIKQRVADGWFDDSPVYGDIKEFNQNDASKYTGKIDVLTGGFPCQPFSVAGKRKGTGDERWLFDEIIKTIEIVQPRRLFFENVPGILADNAIIKIYQSLAKVGYRAKAPLVLGSDDCGNIHRRKRVWIFADATSERCNDRKNYREKRQICETEIGELSENKSKGVEWVAGSNKNSNVHFADGECFRVQGSCEKSLPRQQTLPRSQSIRGVEDILRRPDIPQPLFWGVDDELPDWKQQIKAIGNGQDPIVMATAWHLLREL